MVNNVDVVRMITVATPALATLLVLVTAWRTSHTSGAGGRGAPTALTSGISATLGAVAYLGRATGVESSQVLEGAVIAFLATALALSAYAVIGRFTRRLPFALLAWLATLVPLYVYAFFALLAVAGRTQCPPDAYECPI
jgi:hypothetical protein